MSDPTLFTNASSSQLIEARVTERDPQSGTAEMDFVCPDAFKSIRGFCHGGFVPTFLDEVMGAAVMAASNDQLLPLNLDCNVSYLAPVHIGPLKAKGRVLKMGNKVAYLEGELFDADGKLLARSTSTALLTEVPDGEA